MDNEITGYELSRAWFDFSFENPEKISPNHAAIYFFAIEHCNRMGWKDKFGFPTQMTMDAIGIKKHDTYIKYFRDLCNWGFIKLIEKSTNQYSANIISLKSALPKSGKALQKATLKHTRKQHGSIGESKPESNPESNRSIIKHNNNTEPINNTSTNVLVATEQKPDLKKLYDELLDEITGKDIKTVWTGLKNFICTYKPDFIDPYYDTWNLFAERYNLAKVMAINEKRKNKFKNRVKEDKFDFIGVLDKIRSSNMLRGIDQKSGWKVTFDFIFENDSNYLKVLEGNYDN